MFWLGWLIMSVAASDFSLLSDRALHDNPLVAGKLVHVRLGEVEARTRPTRHTEPRTCPLQCRKPRMRPLEHRETVTFWHLLKEIYHYLFVMESFLIFALQFILRQKSVKGNITITILYLKVFHTHTHNLYFTDFTLKLFIVIFCYCPVSLCVSCGCYR